MLKECWLLGCILTEPYADMYWISNPDDSEMGNPEHFLRNYLYTIGCLVEFVIKIIEMGFTC
jgi:hypothetical protein